MSSAGQSPAAPVAEAAAHMPRLIGDWYELDEDPAAQPFLPHAPGEWEKAIALLNAGLVENPTSATLFEARGALYRALGYRRAAQRDFEQAVELDPERGKAWFGLGLVRQELGLSSIAVSAFERAASLDVDSAELHLSWARAHRALGQRSPAAEHYARTIELHEQHPNEGLLAEISAFFEEEGARAPEATREAFLQALRLEAAAAQDLHPPRRGPEPSLSRPSPYAGNNILDSPSLLP